MNNISSQAWYSIIAAMGILMASLPLIAKVHDQGLVTAYLTLAGSLIGAAVGGLQSDSKKTTTVEKDGKVTSSVSTTATPSAPSSPNANPTT